MTNAGGIPLSTKPKNLPVEAIQWDNDPQTLSEINSLLVRAGTELSDHDSKKSYISFTSPEGLFFLTGRILFVCPGMWIVKTETGAICLMTTEDFQDYYDREPDGKLTAKRSRNRCQDAKSESRT